MRYLIIKNTKVKRFVAVEDFHKIRLKPGESCVLDKGSIQIGDNVYLNGEPAIPRYEPSLLPYVVGFIVIASAAAYYFLIYKGV